METSGNPVKTEVNYIIRLTILYVFQLLFQSVINDMHMNEAMLENDDAVKEEIIKRESILQSRKFILDKAKAFDGTPFTIQR